MLFNLIKRLKSSVLILKSKLYGGKLVLGKNTHLKRTNVIPKKNGSIQIGDNVRSAGMLHLEVAENGRMLIGNNVTFNYNTQIYGDVKIFNDSFTASEVYISSYNHNYITAPFLPIKVADRIHSLKSNKIVIEEDVWLGKNSFVAGGVYIAKGCIIGANVKVTKSVEEPYTILINNYPLIKKERMKFTPPDHLVSKKEHWPYFYRGFIRSNDSFDSIFVQEGIVVLSKLSEKKKINVLVESNEKIEDINFAWNCEMYIDQIEIVNVVSGEVLIIENQDFVRKKEIDEIPINEFLLFMCFDKRVKFKELIML